MAHSDASKNSSFVLPAWWVHAYDATAFEGRPPAISLIPRFTDFELNVLAAFLSLVQRQLIATTTSKIRVSADDVLALFSTGGLRDRNRDLGRTLEMILALRFLHGSNLNQRRNLTVFCEDLRFDSNESDGDYIEWEMTDIGRQMVVGLIEPYSDLVRQSEHQPSLFESFGKRGPLVVWSAPWLDFSGAEQRFLLRLERAMQWDFRWMHLDGIFGERFQELVAGLKVQTGKPNHANGSVAMVQKIQQRLVEHGLLQPLSEIDYLAMQPDPQMGAQLIWQVSSARLQEFEDFSFREQTSAKILWPIYKRHARKIISALSMGTSGTAIQHLERSIGLLADHESSVQMFSQVVSIHGGAVIQQLPLFVEWVVRSQPQHPRPLPGVIGELGLDEVLNAAGRNLASGFEEFQMRVKQMPEAFDRVISQDGATLLLAKPNEREQVLSELRVGLQNVSRSSADFAQNRRVMDSPAAMAVAETPAPLQKSASVQGIRQTASEELQKLRTQEPLAYEELKNRYLESLEPSRRKLLVDVQRRMTPETFEQHLRHSLIKFMIDNPASWRTRASAGSPTLDRLHKPRHSSSAIWGN